MKNSEDYGTDFSGKKTMEYCKNCFQKGEFTEPDITIEKMVERVASRMMKDMGMEVKQAVDLAVELIPRLKRWQ